MKKTLPSNKVWKFEVLNKTKKKEKEKVWVSKVINQSQDKVPFAIKKWCSFSEQKNWDSFFYIRSSSSFASFVLKSCQILAITQLHTHKEKKSHLTEISSVLFLKKKWEFFFPPAKIQVVLLVCLEKFAKFSPSQKLHIKNQIQFIWRTIINVTK